MAQPKLTVNQAEFEKQLKRILRLMKKAEKEGMTFERPIIVKPQRVTKQKIEEAKSITFAKIKEMYSKSLPTAEEETRKARKQGFDDYIHHPRIKKPEKEKLSPEELAEIRRRNLAKAREAQRGKPRTEAQIEATKRNLAKAREAQKNKPRTQAQIDAMKKNLEKARAAQKGKPRTEAQIEATKRNLAKAREARKGKPMTEAQHEAMKKNLEKARQAKKGKPISEKQREASRKNLEKARKTKAEKKWKKAPSRDKTHGDYKPFPKAMTRDQSNYSQVSHIIELLERRITPESAAAIEKIMEAVESMGARKVIKNFKNHPEANIYIDGACFASDEEERVEGLKQLLEIIYDGDIPDEIDEFIGELDDYIDQGRYDFVESPLKPYYEMYGKYGDMTGIYDENT